MANLTSGGGGSSVRFVFRSGVTDTGGRSGGYRAETPGQRPQVPKLEGMVTANPSFTDPSARHAANLSKFVLRARRIEAHSLNRDKDALAALAHMVISMHRHADGTAELVHVLPPEELVESAAARVRPVLLDGDPVYWGKTLAALGYFVQDDADLTATVKVLRQDWRKLMPRDGSMRGYSLIVAGSGLSQISQTLPDSIMAVSWFYGDVVHADPERQAEAVHAGITERYRAAAVMVAGAVMLTVATLNLVRQARDRGLVDLPDDVLTAEVVVDERVGALWGGPAVYAAGEQR
jgi:hypothetical protein